MFLNIDSLNSDEGKYPKDNTLHQQHSESLKTKKHIILRTENVITAERPQI
jgi:hypothetical protein